jgi:hypothetical protein
MTISTMTAGKTANRIAVTNGKKHFIKVFSLALLLLLFFAAAPVFSQAPKLGQPTILQQALNIMPAVPIPAVGSLKFEFGGDIWMAKLGGQNLLAGTMTVQDTPDGSILVLKQTHTYAKVVWVKTPGPDMILDYTKGPPSSLRPISSAEMTEKLAAIADSPAEAQ